MSDFLNEVVQGVRDLGYDAVALVAIRKGAVLNAEVTGIANYDPKIELALGLISSLAELVRQLQEKHGFVQLEAENLG